MRRTLRTGLYLLASIASLSHAGIVASHGALKVAGNKVVDAAGNPIQLAGMSLYWTVFGSNWGGQKFFNSDVVRTMATDWKSSLIRAPAGVITGAGKSVYNYPGTMNLVKAVVDAAIANDIYVIVDWHLENSTPDQGNANQFFTEMSQTYKNTPNIIWEIWNEPKDVGWSNIKSYADNMTALIRKNSANLIVVGTPNWSHNPDQASADPITSDKNIAYAFHFYADQNSNGNVDADNNSAMAAANKALKTVPLFITEWGTVGNSGTGTVNTAWSDKWLTWAKTNGVSWANWSLADIAESNAALKGGASANGGWNDGNLTPSGMYVKAKIAEVTAAIGPGGEPIKPIDPIVPTKVDTIPVPGRIEAEKASTLSADIKVESSTDAGGGSALGFTANGSAEYILKIAQTGSYTLRSRVASAEQGTMTFKLNNNQIASQAVEPTGGWQSWQTKETQASINSTGIVKLKVAWSGSVNLNWLELVSATAILDGQEHLSSPITARSSLHGLDLTLPEGSTELVVTDLQGKICHQQKLAGERDLHLSLMSSNVLLVRVTTPKGVRSVTIAPSR